LNFLIGYANEVLTLNGHSLASWALIGSYVLIGITCLRFAFRRDGVSYREGRQYWLVVSLILFFLAFNRYSEFLPDITAKLRVLAETKNLYGYRRPIQFLIVLEIILLGALFLRRLNRTRHLNRRTIFTITGMLILIVELLLKTISYHPLDRIINAPIGYWTMNGLMESIGIGLVGFAVLLSILRRTKIVVKLRTT